MTQKYFLLIMLIFVSALTACGNSHEKTSAQQHEITLIRAPITSSLYYSGTIQPLKSIVVTSPVDGVIQDMSFHYGDIVKNNAPLFIIVSEKFQSDYKTALLAFIKAKNDFNTSNSQLTQSEFLHKNQLISDDELKTKQTAFYTAQLALVQAKDALEGMVKEINVPGMNLDSLKIENIEKISQALHDQGDSQKLRVNAPKAGVALLPIKSDNDGDTKKLGKGDQVKQGDVLAIIGDTSGLSVRVNVNEFNINELKIGQKVKVTGAAFPNYILQGEISGIDHQAQSSAAGLPTFTIEVVVPTLTQEQQNLIHMGMSAKVQINIEGEPQISVPIGAVFEKDGQTFVNAEDSKTKKIHEVPVKTGQTTADSVTIESSLKPGDKIVFAS